MPRVSGRNTGGSLAFNGSTSLINVTANSVFNTNVFTYTAIVFPTGSGIRTIKGNATTNGPQFRINGSNQLELVKQTVTLIGTSTSIVPNNKFSYVACTYDVSGNYVFYINGLFAGSGTNLQTFVFGNIQIGSQSSGTESFKGKISSFQMYSTAFTSQQIKDNYFSNISNSSTLKFNLDEMTGATATDTSGNGNNGTIVSGTWSIDRPFANRQEGQDIKATSNGISLSAIGTVDTVTSGAGTVIGKAKLFAINGDNLWSLYDSTGTLDSWRFNVESTTGFPFIWTVNTTPSGTTNPKVTDKGSIKKGEWFSYAVVQTISGGVVTGKIYINNQFWGSGTRTSDVRSCSRFGISNSTTMLHSDVAVFERELSLSEINAYSLNGVIPTNPKIYWKGTEGAGNTKYDSSGNGANGTGGTLVWSSDTPTKARRQVGGNMMINGDFETPLSISVNDVSRTSDGHAGNILGAEVNNAWYTFGTGGRAAMLDTSVKYSGTRSIKLSTTDAVGVIQALKGDASFEKINVLPNTSYTITAQCKTNNVAALSAYIGIACEMADGTYAGAFFATNKLSGTNDWTLLTSTFTTTATTRRLYIYCYNIVAGNISDAWYDNITLTPTVNITRTPII